MIATTTSKDFNQSPSKVLKAADRGITTEITSHGQSRAAVIPQPGITSGEGLARSLENLKPQPEVAAEIERLVKGMDEAD